MGRSHPSDSSSSPPSGTLTFLFTDVTGSTALIQDDTTDGVGSLIRTQEAVRDILASRGGHEVHCAGDGYFFVFSKAADAAESALQVQKALEAESIRIRIGMHTGYADQWNGEYMGIDVHRAARIASLANGGQVLMSRSTRELVACDVVDLGEHRLKDLADPIRLFQAGSRAFPTLVSLGQSNLPRPSTSFIGRVRELAALHRLLDSGGARLVTLTGPGGIGKTRLAIELARTRLARHTDGSWWIDLTGVSDARSVPGAISNMIGAAGEVAQFLGKKRCALLLDNFDHLQDAASFISDLLQRCENLEIVVTSRSALRLASEWCFAVDPLVDTEAVTLFCARALAAGAAVRRSAQIAAICRRIENVPLALELAAAKSVFLSPIELLSRLESRLNFLSSAVVDVPDRHRTLRATVLWSYELLDAKERVAFSQLAVFGGGWTVATAQSIFDADFETIESLVKKSFVRAAGGRFDMLELIREFGLEQLEADATRATHARRAHRDYFLAFVEREHQAQSASSMTWRASFEKLESEHENIRAALGFSAHASEENRGRHSALRFCAGLGLYWTNRWHCQEGLQFCLLALSDRRPDSDPEALAGTMWAAAGLSTSVGDLERAAVFYEDALELFRKQGVRAAEAMVLSDVGHLSYLRGDFDLAKSRFARLAQLASDVGDEKLTANAHYGIGRVALAQGEIEVARRNLELARAGYVKVGHRSNQALALLYQGVLATAEAANESAERYLADALVLAREAGDAMNESCIQRCLSDLESGRGNHASARALLRSSLQSNVRSDDMLEVALGLRSAAMLSFRESDFETGALMLGAAQQAGTTVERLLSALLSHPERELIDGARRALRDRFDVLERKGAGMSTRAAIEAALRNLSRKTSNPRGASGDRKRLTVVDQNYRRSGPTH